MFSARKTVVVNTDLNSQPQSGMQEPPTTGSNTDPKPQVNEAVNTPAVVPSSSVAPQIPVGVQNNKNHEKGSKGKYFLFLIPAFLVLLAMVLISFYLNSQKNQAPTLTESPAPSLEPAAPLPTPTGGVPSDLKTYQNKTYLFSFNYDSSYELIEQSGAQPVSFSGVGDVSRSLLGVQLKKPPATNPEIYITVEPSTSQGNPVPLLPSEQPEGLENGEVVIGGKNASYLNTNDGGVYVVTYDKYLYRIFWNGNKDNVGKIVSSFRFLNPGITDSWQRFDSSLGQFSLRFPPEWKLVSGGSASSSAEIRKNELEKEYQVLNMEIQRQTGKDNAALQLTASETISSLQNLGGWQTTPVVDYRLIGGGQAQLISGERLSGWEVYAVFWFRNSLLQISWRDTQGRSEQENLDFILSSVSFR